MSEWMRVANLVKYTLMHKRTPVLDIVLEDDDGSIIDIGQAHDLEHAPLGTVRYGQIDKDLLKTWWRSRSIPASRKNIRSFLARVNLPNTQYLLTKSMGLSLSDQYWIRREGTDTDWSDVNFFENDFSEDIGDLLFGHAPASQINLMSPDNTSDGVLKKRWKIIDGKRCLLKAGRDRIAQEVYNEIIATRLCEAMDIPHAEYGLLSTDYDILCVSEDFIDVNTELVSAAAVLNSYTHLGQQSRYMEYVNACANLGYDIAPFLDRMIVLDYIMENYDRHFNNFGLIRDVDTLKILRPAPIFDTGSSLRCNLPPSKFWDVENKSLPFEDSFDEQLKHVRSFDWIDFHRLYSVLDDVEELLKGTILEKVDVADSMVELLDRNMSKLRAFAKGR